jgi:hypothetical protein
VDSRTMRFVIVADTTPYVTGQEQP